MIVLKIHRTLYGALVEVICKLESTQTLNNNNNNNATMTSKVP